MSREVVITGCGVLSPQGNSVRESWQSAISGVSGIGPITRFDATLFSTRIAGEIKNFEPTDFIDAKEVKKLDLFSQFSIAAAEEAMKEAGISDISQLINPSKAGCIIGVGIGGISTLEKYHNAFHEGGPRKISPFLIPAMISNLAPGNIAIKHGLKGINYALTSACTSATHAIGESYRMIKDGLQDIIVTGGAESAITPMGIGGFCSIKAMSTRNDDPTRASRPFDSGRDGFVMGEGAVVLVLEEKEIAKKRGANILAEVVGYGFSCDAFHITAPCVDGAGAQSCMQMALDSARLDPAAISYLNAHGTSTDANDRSETLAIKKVFGNYAKEGLLVSSTKSMTGHLLGAAGAVEAFFCGMALKHQIIPPTINFENPDPECDLDYVPNSAREARLEYAMSNSFGFGGTNASIILKKV